MTNQRCEITKDEAAKLLANVMSSCTFNYHQGLGCAIGLMIGVSETDADRIKQAIGVILDEQK